MPGNSISYPMVKDEEKVKKVPKVKDEEKVKSVDDEVEGARIKFKDVFKYDGNVENMANVEHFSRLSNSQPYQQHNAGASACQPPRAVPRKRLEDVFQDDIIKAFVKLSEFKKFARSRDGLRLSEYDIETICEDYNSSEERKMKMLNKWKQKQGRNGTVERILQIKENYIIKLNEED